jgi:predicted CxxxxCH...CXXCH cytochrome family protein
LNTGTTYYFTVRAENNANLQSSAQNSNGVLVDSTPPTNVGCQTPTDWTYDVATSTTLWARQAGDTSSGGVSYRFKYTKDKTLSNWGPPDGETKVAFETYQYWDITGLANSTTYYWQVQARDNAGNESDWCAYPDVAGSTYAFVTVALPGNTSPTVNTGTAEQLSSTTTVRIPYTVGDGQESQVIVSIKYFWAGQWLSPTSPWGDIGTVSTGAATVYAYWDVKKDLTAENTAQVRIYANDIPDSTGTATTNVFNFDTRSPQSVTAESPKGMITVSTSTALTATLGSDYNTISYQFRISTGTIFNETGTSTSSYQVSDNDWAPSNLTNSTTYYWQVRARDYFYNETNWTTPISSFVTVSAGVPPSTSTYNFSIGYGESRWAKENAGSDFTLPTDAGTSNFDANKYNEIASYDVLRATTIGTANNGLCAQCYLYWVSESVTSISQLTATWDGYGMDTTPDARAPSLYIWNFNTPGWELLQTGAAQSSDQTLTGNKTTSISYYVQDSSCYVKAVSGAPAGGKKSNLYSNYTKLEVNLSGSAGNQSPTDPTYAVVTPSPTFSAGEGLTCKAKGSTDDNNNVTYVFQWYRNSSPVIELSSGTATSGTQELSVSTPITVNAGDTVYCLVKAYDGTSYSGAFQSNVTTATAAAPNDAPEINSVAGVVAEQRLGTGVIVSTISMRDQNGDSIVYQIYGLDSDGDGSFETTLVPDTVDPIHDSTSIILSASYQNYNFVAKKTATNADTSNAKVRFQLKDEHGSVSEISTSSVFALDTRAPQIKTTTYLLVNPVSGDNVLQLRSIWYETNPNTATFQAAINGTTYGGESSGTVEGTNISTATVNYPAGSLTGSSYIDKIRSIFTDDYGNISSWSENNPATDWYVRPLVPSTPTIVAVYSSSLTIRIEPNLLENGTSIYFLIRSTSPGFSGDQYVHSNSSGLVTTGFWRSTYNWVGPDVTIIDLTPGGTYYFSIAALNPKISDFDGDWDNLINGPPQANSTSTFSISIGTVTQPTVPSANQRPEITITSALQGGNTTTITVNYTLSDIDNSSATITLYYEWSSNNYSVTGALGNVGPNVSTGTGKSASFDAKKQTNLNGKDTADGNTRVYIYADDLSGGTTGVYSGNVSNFDAKNPAGSIASPFVSDPQSGQSTLSLKANWEDPAGSTNNLTTPQFAYKKNGAASYSTWADGGFYSGTEFRINSNWGGTLGTLDGNDYFNGITSQASDKYGNETSVENTTTKYVKPQTPPAPTISQVYSTSMTIQIVPQEQPAGKGLFYLIKATSPALGSDKYVQSSKTLGDAMVWQSTGTGGWDGWSFVVTVQGGTTYYFSVCAANAEIDTGESYSGTPPSNSASDYGPSISTVTQPAMNNTPDLSWLGITGYQSDGVHPDTGIVDSTYFVYKVRYYDVDGDTPTAGYPKLQISLDQSTWVYTMSVLGTPLWNTTYYYQLKLGNVTNQYKYRMVAQDNGSPPQTKYTDLKSGPTVYTENPILVADGTTTVYGVEGSSVNRVGSNVITIKSYFVDNDESPVTKYYVTFKVSSNTATGSEIILVNNKTHKGLGEANYSDVRNFVNIAQDGSTYTVTYAWDPSTSVPTGAYALYFRVTDGADEDVDVYDYNLNELYVRSQVIVITELPKGTLKLVPGKTVCQSCHTHRNRDWQHRDTRVPDYDCLTCHSAHGSDVGTNIQLVRGTITASVTLSDFEQGIKSTMTVIFRSTAPFTNMGTWDVLYPGTTGFGLVSVDTVGVQGGYGPCQVCHIQAKSKGSTYSLYYATSTAVSQTHGGSDRNCGQCHSHMPNPIIESVTTDPVECSTMAAITITINGKHFDMRIARSSDTSVQLTHSETGISTYTVGTAWLNATKLVTTVSTRTLTVLTTGWYNLTVYNPNGKDGTLTSAIRLRSADYFKVPVINNFTPTSGPPGTQVTIGGSYFYSPVTVIFGTKTATNLYWVSESSVNAIVPELSPMTTTITLINGVGKSTTTTNTFQVIAPPEAIPEIREDGIVPNFGSAGAIFEIYGSSFGITQGQVNIYGDQYESYGDWRLMIICNDSNEILRWTNNYIQVKIPSFRASDILSASKQSMLTLNTKVNVVSASGSSSTYTTDPDNFTLICLPPKVESVKPVSASQGVDVPTVTVRGKYFSPGARLYLRKQGEVFEIEADNVNLVNISTITGQFSFLSDQTTGYWRVIVRNPDLKEPTEELVFEVLAAPSITSVVPNWTSSDTAKVVTIYGTGFRDKDYNNNNVQPVIKLSTSSDFIPAITVSSRNYESATIIRATFPALTEYPGYPLGWYRLKITNPDYYGVATLEIGFKYEPVSVTTPPPSIVSISPSEVYNNVNTTITITGANFVSTPTVKIGAPVATAYDALNEIWNSATQMKAVLPAGLPPGTTDVSVINFYGSVIASTATKTGALTIIKGAYACNDCHNAPTFSGTHGTSHRKHYDTTLVPTKYGEVTNNSAGTQYKFACGKCHQGTHMEYETTGASTGTALRVDITFDTTTTPSNPVTASYSITATTNVYLGADGNYYGWTTGTCNNLYCHGKFGDYTIGLNANPQWASGSLSCTACHSTGTVTISGSSHRKHVSTYSFTCDYCHEGIVSGNTQMLDTSKHVNGYANIDLMVTTAVIGSSAKYRGQESTAVVTGGGSSYGSCGSLYCHSTATGSYKTIQWGGTATCSSCHEVDSPAKTLAAGVLPTTGPATGSHLKHTKGPWSYTCDRCHPYNDPATDLSKHVNYQINVTTGGYPANKAPGSGYQTCSNIPNCHGGGSPEWGNSATATCESCHLINGADADDWNINSNFSAKISSSEWYGSTHKKDSASDECTDCHNSGVAHRVSTNPFRLNGSYLGAGGDISNFCRDCHQTNSSKVSISTHTHSQAITSAGGGDWGIGAITPLITTYKCVDCHDPHGETNYKMVRSTISRNSSNTTGIPSSNGLGTRALLFTSLAPKASDYATPTDFLGDQSKICQTCHQANKYYTINYGSPTAHNGGNNKDSCTSCHSHSDGFKGSCTTCHGNPDTGVWWPTSTVNGTSSPDRAGAHEKHIIVISSRNWNILSGTSETDKKNQTCIWCHTSVTAGHDSNTSGSPAGIADLHRDGFNQSTYFKNIKNQTDSNATRSTEAMTCANIDCHYESNLGVWRNAPVPNDPTCDSCHARPPDAGAHIEHTNKYTPAAENCTKCHPEYRGIVYISSYSHTTGEVDMDFTLLGSTFGYTGSEAYSYGKTCSTGSINGTCSNIYCHGTAASRQWNQTIGASECNVCHYRPPAEPASGGHPLHVDHSTGTDNNSTASYYDYGCGKCHSSPGVADWPGKHALGKPNPGTYPGWVAQTTFTVLGSAPTNPEASYSVGAEAAESPDAQGFKYTQGTCQNLYCHGNTLNTNNQGTVVNPQWGTTQGCGNSCHKAATLPNVNGVHLHGSHLGSSKQMSPSGGYQFDCARCHISTDNNANGTPQVNVKSSHVDGGVIDVDFDDNLNPGGNWQQ